jgi:hypothetical protein
MNLVKSGIEFALIVLLLIGYAHETEIARFERLLFSKRGRQILKKNLMEMVK